VGHHEGVGLDHGVDEGHVGCQGAVARADEIHELDTGQHVSFKVEPVEADVDVTAQEGVEKHVVVHGVHLRPQKLEHPHIKHGQTQHARVVGLVHVYESAEVEQLHALSLDQLAGTRLRTETGYAGPQVAGHGHEAVPLEHHNVHPVAVRHERDVLVEHLQDPAFHGEDVLCALGVVSRLDEVGQARGVDFLGLARDE